MLLPHTLRALCAGGDPIRRQGLIIKYSPVPPTLGRRQSAGLRNAARCFPARRPQGRGKRFAGKDGRGFQRPRSQHFPASVIQHGRAGAKCYYLFPRAHEGRFISPRQAPVSRPCDSTNSLKRSRSPLTRIEAIPIMSPTFSTTPSGVYSI